MGPWRLATTLLAARDTHTLWRRIVEGVRSIMRADAVVLLLYDRESAHFVPTVPSVALGLDELWLQRQGLEGLQELAQRAADSSTIAAIPTMAAGSTLEVPPLASGRAPGTVYLAPMTDAGATIGAIVVAYASPHTGAFDSTLLQSVAAVAAAALVTSRTTTREQTLRTRLEALDAATRTLAAELSPVRVLQRIVDIAAEIVGARYAALGVTGEDGYLRDFITTGLTAQERARIGPLPRGHGLLGVLMRQGQPLRVPNITRDPRRGGFPSGHPPMTSLLGVPIRVRDEVVGDLYLADKIGAADFSDEDQHLVEMLAAHAGVAIENARLYQRERDAHHALERALESLRASEASLRQQAALIDLAHDAIIVRDLGGAIISWNQGAAAMYGWTAEEAAGHITHAFLQTQFPISAEAVDAVLARTGTWEGELTHMRRDGERIVVESRQVLVRGEAGTPTAVLEINRNITQRKQAEEALRFLAETGTVLGTSLDEEALCAAVTRFVVPFLAGWCGVVTLDGDGSLRVRALTRAEAAAAGPLEELLRRDLTSDEEGPLGVPSVVRESRPLLVSYVRPEAHAGNGEGRAELAAAGITASMIVPLVARGATLGALVLLHTGDTRARPYDAVALALAEDVAGRVALALANARLYGQVRELTLLRERERIGRDLHDGIIQDIYAGTLQLEALAQDLPAPAAAELERVAEHFSGVIGEVRTYIQGLRARELQGRLLSEGLAVLVQDVNRRGGPAVTNTIGGEPYRLPDEVANTLLHITREALSNVVRHAHAMHAHVELHYDQAVVRLTITDDGMGFAPEQEQGDGHHGLRNMRARVAESGGTLTLVSRPDCGTTLTVQIPTTW